MLKIELTSKVYKFISTVKLIYHFYSFVFIVLQLFFFLFFTFSVYLGKKVSRLTLVTAQKIDNRLSLMNQIIAGVEIIKMYVWEIPYSLLVEKARK